MNPVECDLPRQHSSESVAAFSSSPTSVSSLLTRIPHVPEDPRTDSVVNHNADENETPNDAEWLSPQPVEKAWPTLPASKKSLRTRNPIRAIVDAMLGSSSADYAPAASTTVPIKNPTEKVETEVKNLISLAVRCCFSLYTDYGEGRHSTHRV